MSGEIDFSSVGLSMFNPIGLRPPPARLEQTNGQPPTSTAQHGTAGADATAPAGHDLHLSQDLQKLCKNLNDAAHRRQGRKETFTGSIVKPYTHPDLTETVKNASGSRDVKRSSPHKQDLRDSFSTVHKPVVILDGDGSVDYVFVHVDGEWRGFDGAFRPLPGALTPTDAMMNICGRSNTGMWFTQYDVKTDLRVIEPRTTRPDDAHDDDDGSNIDFQRELSESLRSVRSYESLSSTSDRDSLLSRHSSVSAVSSRSLLHAPDEEVSPPGSPTLQSREPDHG